MKENEILSGPENRNPEGHMRSLSIEQDIIRKVQQGDVDGLIDGATKFRQFVPTACTAAAAASQEFFSFGWKPLFPVRRSRLVCLPKKF